MDAELSILIKIYKKNAIILHSIDVFPIVFEIGDLKSRIETVVDVNYDDTEMGNKGK